jgi:anti-sigma B factor antagonist
MDVFIRLSHKGSPVTVVRLLDEKLSAAIAREVRKELSQILTEKPGHFLLDLSQVSLIDSVGLSVLVGAHRHCRTLGYQLKFCGLQEQVKLLFAIVGLDTIYEIYPSVEKALESFP